MWHLEHATAELYTPTWSIELPLPGPQKGILIILAPCKNCLGSSNGMRGGSSLLGETLPEGMGIPFPSRVHEFLNRTLSFAALSGLCRGGGGRPFLNRTCCLKAWAWHLGWVGRRQLLQTGCCLSSILIYLAAFSVTLEYQSLSS
jgi:hypothetical protein